MPTEVRGLGAVGGGGPVDGAEVVGVLVVLVMELGVVEVEVGGGTWVVQCTCSGSTLKRQP